MVEGGSRVPDEVRAVIEANKKGLAVPPAAKQDHSLS